MEQTGLGSRLCCPRTGVGHERNGRCLPPRWPDGGPPQLEGMASAITHGGPDRWGIWCEGSAGLGHRALWTTCRSLHETLPFVKERNDLILTADARIENRYELRAAPGMAPQAFADVTDVKS